MIGVIANPSEFAVAREFFELFKTPWEFYRSDRQYDVLLCTGARAFPEDDARLILIYAGRPVAVDVEAGIQTVSGTPGQCPLTYGGTRIPVYGQSVTFRQYETAAPLEEDRGRTVMHVRDTPTGRVIRIGYDLFREVRVLLTAGQPVANADAPTLDLHIALLRDLIIANGIELVEAPPVPEGYRFIACLTHDIDHPSIRRHQFDRTMFGFLYRALIGSSLAALRGRMPLRHLLTNWAAAAKLPFVYCGLANDPWLEFTRYLEFENGLPSTFFVIPFQDSPGRGGQVQAPSARAARYSAADITPQLGALMSAGCEIGLHGIDAWLDSASGTAELEEVRQVTNMREIGVRMHWLYLDDQSSTTIENAGAEYDSTFGYNETVGYRAGTTQAFKPLDVARMLELPLHVMDTALFFPNYLALSPKEARQKIRGIIAHAVKCGGSVTVNWHDRSIAPERLWGDTYLEIIGDLKKSDAWFATAAQAVAWFRKRRAAVFVNTYRNQIWQWAIEHEPDDLPALQVRVHNKQPARNSLTLSTFQRKAVNSN